MSNLFRQYIESKPVRTPLAFGHNSNIIISKIDTEQRKFKETILNVSLFITFTQIEPETKKEIGNYEGSFWNFDPTKGNIAQQINDQFSIMYGIVRAVGGDEAKFDNDAINDIDGLGTDMELSQFASTKENAKKLQDSIQTAFLEGIDGKVGADCPLLQCKLISNKKGYLNLSREVNWIMPMGEEGLAEVTDTEKKVYSLAQQEAATPKQGVPDTTGKPAGEQPTTKKTAFGAL